MPERLTPATRLFVESLVADGGHCPSCLRVGTVVLAHDDAEALTRGDWRWVAEVAVCEVLAREGREDEERVDGFDPYDTAYDDDPDADTPEEERIRSLQFSEVPSAFADALGDLDTEEI